MDLAVGNPTKEMLSRFGTNSYVVTAVKRIVPMLQTRGIHPKLIRVPGHMHPPAIHNRATGEFAKVFGSKVASPRPKRVDRRESRRLSRGKAARCLGRDMSRPTPTRRAASLQNG